MRPSAYKYARKCAGVYYPFSWTKGGSLYGGIKHAVTHSDDRALELTLWATLGPIAVLMSLLVGGLGLGFLLVALEGPSDSQRLGNQAPTRLERRMR